MLFKAPDQWTTVPLLVKIYKLLINELSNQIEQNTASQKVLDDDEDGGEEVVDFKSLSYVLII
jgi:hypothetical protein